MVINAGLNPHYFATLTGRKILQIDTDLSNKRKRASAILTTQTSKTPKKIINILETIELFIK
jgi:hypothetical protein